MFFLLIMNGDYLIMNFAAMTRWTEEEIPCPKCGQKKRIKKYQVINASEKPHLKEKILKNEVFFFQCENCKLSAPLTYPSLYLDSKKRLAISLSPEIEGEKYVPSKLHDLVHKFTCKRFINLFESRIKYFHW